MPGCSEATEQITDGSISSVASPRHADVLTDRVLPSSAGDLTIVPMSSTSPTDLSAPIVTVWTHHDGSFGGISPSNDREWVSAVERHGHAIVTDSRYHRPMNHHIAGVGIGHDDAKFCESGDSFAAYLENGEAFGGPWWEQDLYLAHYDPAHPKFAAKRAGQW